MVYTVAMDCGSSSSSVVLIITPESVVIEERADDLDSGSWFHSPVEEDIEDPVSHLNSPVLYSYSVKLVNPAKKSEYRVHNVRDAVKFSNMKQLEEFVKTTFDVFQNCDDALCMGFVEPGHGWKGKQRWLNDDTDLEELYTTYQAKKKDVLLWCHLPGQKSRKRSATKNVNDEPQSKRSQSTKKNDDKTTEVNKIFKALSEKHESGYTPEQLHAWAHLIQLKKHSSLVDPPDYPYFRGYRAQKKEKNQVRQEKNEVRQEKIESSAALSPQRKVKMRSECISQHQKIGELLEQGCISQDQFEKLQETIMKDITTL